MCGHTAHLSVVTACVAALHPCCCVCVWLHCTPYCCYCVCGYTAHLTVVVACCCYTAHLTVATACVAALHPFCCVCVWLHSTPYCCYCVATLHTLLLPLHTHGILLHTTYMFFVFVTEFFAALHTSLLLLLHVWPHCTPFYCYCMRGCIAPLLLRVRVATLHSLLLILHVWLHCTPYCCYCVCGYTAHLTVVVACVATLHTLLLLLRVFLATLHTLLLPLHTPGILLHTTRILANLA